MTRLLLRNLRYYWRTNAAVVAGVATAVAVLAGALLVGQSVRASLRDLLNERLGATDYVVSADRFFREELARAFAAGRPAGQRPRELSRSSRSRASSSGRARPAQAYDVNVYGVDERFWRFHGLPAPPGFEDRAAIVGAPLAAQLGRPAPATACCCGSAAGRTSPASRSTAGARARARTIRLTCSGSRRHRSSSASSRCGPARATVFSLFVPLAAAAARPGSSRVGANTILDRQHVAAKTNCRRLAAAAARARHPVGRRRPPAVARRRGRASQSRARASCWTTRSPRRRSSGERGRPAGVRRVRLPRQRHPCAGARHPLQRHCRGRSRAGRAGRRPARGGLAHAASNGWTRTIPSGSTSGPGGISGYPSANPIDVDYYHWEEGAGLVTRTRSVHSRGRRGHRRRSWTRRSRPTCRASPTREPACLGPAVPDRPWPDSPGGRGVLGALPRHAEGVRHAGGRAGAVAEAASAG